MAHSTKEHFKKYLSEIIVIFLGISISFWFDEWRDERKDREIERQILLNLRENMSQDTFILTKTIEGNRNMLNGINKLIVVPKDPQTVDNISIFIDNATSYFAFNSNQATYEEIKQTGRTFLIRDDTLKKAIMAHYTSMIPVAKEWCEVDKTHTMTQLIPAMSEYFPVTIDTTNTVSKIEKSRIVSSGKIRNLLLTNYIYKVETNKILEIVQQRTKAVMKRIDKNLSKT